MPNPYDELPYCAFPIGWTAPERLALTSLIHGGPRVPLDHYRVLELGCANGANLLPMAWYRQHAEFVGLDASARQISQANESRDKLSLSNLQFIHGDFRSAVDLLESPFDIIMAHGVFSWVKDEVRDAMLELCSSMLAPGGLLYLNYNTHPGWTVRGMVRDFLLQKTSGINNLEERAQMCRGISAMITAPFKNKEHSYTQLMANEFQLVANQDPAYIAHEYLSPENNAYWRTEFFTILRDFGFDYVADADFNCISNRITNELSTLLTQSNMAEQFVEDSADLLLYRQMQSPILTHAPFKARSCDDMEFSNLIVASNLEPIKPGDGNKPSFREASGREIESDDKPMIKALTELHSLWPHGRRVKSLFSDVSEVREDLESLIRQDMIELRCIEPGEFDVSPEPLNALEHSLRNISTSAWHTMTRHPVAE